MKNLIILFFIIAFSMQCLSQSKSVSSAVGSTYRDINELTQFSGYKELQGLMLSGGKDDIAISRIAKGNYNLVLLEKCTTQQQKVKYTMLDAIVIGYVSKGQDVIFSTCYVNKHRDENLIALVERGDKEYYKSVVKAWKIDRSTNKLEAISVKNIACLNDGFEACD